MNDQHLTPDQLAAYLRRKLSPTDRTAVERHLVMCDQCREESTEVARYFARSGFNYRRLVALSLTGLAAAVACLLLWPRSVPIPTANAPLRHDPSEAARRFPIVEPPNGAVVPVSGLVFRWRSEESDPYYRVHVLNEVGDVVWRAELPDTSVRMPADVRLEAGQVYFWYVDALLRGIRSSTTGVNEFVTAR